MVMPVEQGENEYAENAEINVTPFIDVMLVLLIIFIIAAPLSTVDVRVDLPTSSAKANPPPRDPVTVNVGSDRTVSVGDRVVNDAGLVPMLATATRGDCGTVIYLRGDKRVPYEAIMHVMDRLRRAGYTKLALVGLESDG